MAQLTIGADTTTFIGKLKNNGVIRKRISGQGADASEVAAALAG